MKKRIRKREACPSILSSFREGGEEAH